jgi:hypothetical protein
MSGIIIIFAVHFDKEIMGDTDKFYEELSKYWANERFKKTWENILNNIALDDSIEKEKFWKDFLIKLMKTGTYGHYDGETIEEEGVTYVKVPEVFETESVKDIVAKVTNIEFFLNMFSGVRNPEYRRPYEILADLDKIIIDALDSQAEELGDGNNGKLPAEILIPYKDAGDAIFKFSHFEIDESEPDASYRTAFVCYEFNTTVS